jgi:thioredoxin 2
MNTIEADDRGLVRVCPQCDQRNRLIYERLGSVFRCSKCRTAISLPGEPFEVPDMTKFDSLIARSALPVLVDFWAPWCGPCKMVAPELAKVAADGVGRWLVAKVNTDEVPEFGERFGIRAIPTLVLFKVGREAARQSGALSAPGILHFLQQSL